MLDDYIDLVTFFQLPGIFNIVYFATVTVISYL